MLPLSAPDEWVFEERVDHWWRRLAKELEVPIPASHSPEANREPSEMTLAKLRKLPSPNKPDIINYYRGKTPNWVLVRDRHTIHRSATDEVLKLLAQGRRSVLVTASAGGRKVHRPQAGGFGPFK